MECLLDDLRAFGINADQWATVAQDEGEWRKTEEQGVERFLVKLIAAEKLGLDYGMQLYVSERAGRTKERIAHRERARAGSLAKVD